MLPDHIDNPLRLFVNNGFPCLFQDMPEWELVLFAEKPNFRLIDHWAANSIGKFSVGNSVVKET